MALRLPPRPAAPAPAAAPSEPTRPDAILLTAPVPPPSVALEPDLEADARAVAAYFAAPTEGHAPAAPAPTYTDHGTVQWDDAAVRALLAVLAPDERMAFLAAVEGRAAPQLTFRAWIASVRPGYQFHRYSEVLIAVLQDVADGLRTRVMVFMPPQLGKSELVSRLFAAYYLYRHPGRSVGLATYGADLSHNLSRDARANFVEGGGELADDSRSVRHWRTSAGGGLWAVGAGGAAAGKGFSLGIVDDPLKDAEEAGSARIRRKRQDWYDSVFYQRKAAGAAIIILMTRWHLEDLAGTLLLREASAPEGWHVVRFASLAEPPRRAPIDPTWGRAGRPAELDDPDRLPPSCTLEPDWRPAPPPGTLGESVCEPRKPRADLLQIMRALGGENGYYWNALHQQRPVSLAGGMFKREHFIKIPRNDCPPLAHLTLVRGWDFGATEGDGDKTVGLLIGRAKVGTAWAGKTIILGCVSGRWDPTKRDAIIRQTIEADGLGVHQRAPQDPAQAGKTHARHFATLATGYSWSTVPTSGDKALNALPAAADAGAGYYYIVNEAWAEEVLRVLTTFGPASSEDDEVDALSIGHNYLAAMQRAEDERARLTQSSAVGQALDYLHRR